MHPSPTHEPEDTSHRVDPRFTFSQLPDRLEGGVRAPRFSPRASHGFAVGVFCALAVEFGVAVVGIAFWLLARGGAN